MVVKITPLEERVKDLWNDDDLDDNQSVVYSHIPPLVHSARYVKKGFLCTSGSKNNHNNSIH